MLITRECDYGVRIVAPWQKAKKCVSTRFVNRRGLRLHLYIKY